MLNNSRLAKSVRLALAIGAVSTFGAMSAAYAQEADSEDEKVEKIQVTGSKLSANPNLAGATPVLSVSGAEASVRGNLRIEDFVNVLPQVFAGQTSEVSNGSTGTSTLNLRGLGAVRTLVLIDGKRLPYGSSQTSSVNADLVPTQLVERVDLLTGGSSAVYGSDAISGVVNFVLQKDFEGVEFGGQWSTNYNANDNDFFANVLEAGQQPAPGSSFDGEETSIYAKFGANTADGRGNVVLFASYENRNPIVQSERDFSACTLGQASGSTSFGGFGCGGSANFRLFAGAGGTAFQEDDGTIVPFSGIPTQRFNFGAQNFFQRPSERYQIYGRASYDITDNLTAYLDASLTNNTSDAQIAPSASFGAYSLNCGNPFLQNSPGLSLTDIYGCSAEDIANDTIVNGVVASHRNVEGGPRNSFLENTAFRLVGGLTGVIADTWTWNAFTQVSETRDQSISTNDFIVSNVQQAFFATTDADGNVVCIDQSNGCVPYNPFQRGPNGETLITQEQLDFLLGPGIINGRTKQLVVGGDIQANLGEYGLSLPWTDAGIGLLVGVEYREDELNANPDVISQVPGGGFTGVGGETLPTAGTVKVSEYYAELEVPIVTDAFLAKELTLRGQYRYSDYDVSGNGESNSFDTDAYGASLTWAPIEDVRLRAQYQRAVRAPNVIELFTGQGVGLANLQSSLNANGATISDPCASDAPIATLEQCARTGVTPAQFGNILDVISGQTQAITGGNPFLTPEVADTVTLGVVYTPSYIKNLSISVDYFDIEVEDAIFSGIPVQTILDTCLETGDPRFCDLIVRAPNGSLASGFSGSGFQQTNVNIGELTTSGVDVQISYRHDIGSLGSLSYDLASTYVDELNTVSFPGADTIACAGIFSGSCGTPNARYRHRFLSTWSTPWNLDLTLTWRYFDETKNDDRDNTFEPTLDAVNYFDLTATYQLTDTWQLRGGVLNLLGEEPPIDTNAGAPLGNGNTYPGVFDVSTNFFLSFKATF